MNDQVENINPWAEKLQQATTPDMATSWQAMKALLDSEMPVSKNNEWKKWVLLFILLLLLIGVCNCPGIMKTNKLAGNNEIPGESQQGYNKTEVNPKADAFVANSNDSMQSKSGSGRKSSDSTKTGGHEKTDASKIDSNQKATISKSTGSLNQEQSRLLAVKKRLRSKRITTHASDETTAIDSILFNPAEKANRVSRNQMKKKYSPDDSRLHGQYSTKKEINETIKQVHRENDNPDELIESGIHEQDSLLGKMDTPAGKIIPKMIASDSLKKIALADSLNKKKRNADTKKEIKADSVEDAKGLLLAVGLNQFFPVGNQEKSNFNSSGTSGGIGDYIPVPVVRYYFHKWLYAQAEAQFNTPQYTRTLLASQTITTDTAKSVFIKKLFYFNLPLSVHYSPVKNLYIGAGLQYSMLTNGVALFQNARPGAQSQVVLRSNDSLLISTKVASFKNDPVYHELKTYEFRFLFDLNYQWKPLTLGFWYNQAFTNFIDVNVSNATITQAHNASLQLYLRYTIWDHRKKFLLPK